MRLKPDEAASPCDPASRFQYQKGAIKTRRPAARDRRDDAFQYQKGAIKTAVAALNRHPERAFQYQKGAIKTFVHL